MACLMSYLDDDDIKEIRQALGSSEAQTEQGYLRDVLNKVVIQMTRGTNMSPLFMDMVKVCATTDIVQKKLVYLYMSNYAHTKPDLAVLTINTLCKDCKESNPMVRGLALKTLCSLRLPGLSEYIENPLLDGLKDSSAYVRRVAVLGCVKIHQILPGLSEYIENPLLDGLKDSSAYVRRVAVLGCVKIQQMNSQFIATHNITDVLYDMLSDTDVIVVTNILGALEELLAGKGGVVINQRIAHFLLNRLVNLTEWGQCFVLQKLLKYKPSTEDEVYDIMNLVDLYVKHTNCGVSMAAVTLMLHITQDSVHQDVCKRLKGPLLILLSSDHPEIVYTALCHIQWVRSKLPKLCTKYYKKFYCRSKDPSYVKYKKLEILGELCTEDSLPDIIEELSVCCTDISSQLAQQAIQTLSTIAKKGSPYSSSCIAALLGLLNLQLDHVSSEILVIFQDLLSYESNQEYIPHVLSQLGGCETIQSSRGKSALIWLLGQYGQSLPDAPYILENQIDMIEEEPDPQVKLHLLTATAKLFFTRPAECQDMLGKLIEITAECDADVDVKERAQFYYRMLNTDVKKAKEVICASLTPVTSNGDNVGTNSKTLCGLDNFNSLSILFGPLKWSQIQLGQTDKSPIKQKHMPSSYSTAADGPAEEGQSVATAAKRSLPAAEGQLIDIDGEASDPVDKVQLVADVTVTPEEFEAAWTDFPVYDTVEMPLLESLDPKEAYKLIEACGCKIMATTPDDADPWRAFVYAKDHSDTLYLVEVLLVKETDIITFTIKVKDQSSTDIGVSFAQYLQQAFS